MRDFKSIFVELQQRRVFRIASVYVVAMWIVVQGALDLFPVFGIPDWTARLLVVIAVLGLPVAIVLAWAFQVTPSGIVRDTGESEASTGSARFRLDLVVVAAALVLGAFLLVRSNFDLITSDPVEQITNLAPPASIAVLPFQNFSDDKDTGYFSDGLSEELLNVLASVPGMNVASRTSSFSYRDSDADIPTIAANLNVLYILEGSVRRSGSQVRITAQLIDARTDLHEWSETYDRELKDVFAIQDEIAAAIVERLHPTLMAARGGGNPPGQRPPATTNMQAYDLYLRGLFVLRDADVDNNEEGQRLLQQALELDPEFARAQLMLASDTLQPRESNDEN